MFGNLERIKVLRPISLVQPVESGFLSQTLFPGDEPSIDLTILEELEEMKIDAVITIAAPASADLEEAVSRKPLLFKMTTDDRPRSNRKNEIKSILRELISDALSVTTASPDSSTPKSTPSPVDKEPITTVQIPILAQTRESDQGGNLKEDEISSQIADAILAGMNAVDKNDASGLITDTNVNQFAFL